MKKLLLIPAMCLFCFACSSNSRNYGTRAKDNSDCHNNGAQSQDASADWAITTKVKTAIMADTSISAFARFVSVSTTDGVVTLTGTVPTRADRDKIGKIAKSIRGVVRVDNQITVSND